MKGWWKKPFIECLKEERRETVCADAVGISRRTLFYAKASDPEFREQVARAHADRGQTDVDRSLSRLHRHHRRETADL